MVNGTNEGCNEHSVIEIDADNVVITTTFQSFVEDNDEGSEAVDEVRKLQVGQKIVLGGGAAELVTIRRLS